MESFRYLNFMTKQNKLKDLIWRLQMSLKTSVLNIRQLEKNFTHYTFNWLSACALIELHSFIRSICTHAHETAFAPPNNSSKLLWKCNFLTNWSLNILSENISFTITPLYDTRTNSPKRAARTGPDSKFWTRFEPINVKSILILENEASI